MADEKLAAPKVRFRGFDDAWERRKFKDFTKLSQGLQIAISERFLENNGQRKFYITNEFLNPNSSKEFYIENPPESVIVSKEDILMTRTGNTGKIVTDVEGAFHNNFFKIDFDHSKNDRWFLYYVLTSSQMQKEILVRAGTSTIPDLNHSDFYKIIVSVSTYGEQVKIGSFFRVLDKALTLHQRKLDKLQVLKKALLEKMFPTEGYAKPQVRFKGYTHDWERRKLSEIADLTSSKRVHAQDYVDTGIPFYRGKEISELKEAKGVSEVLYISTQRYEEMSRLYGSPQIGDLLITAVGTIGNTWVVDAFPFYFKDGNLIWFPR